MYIIYVHIYRLEGNLFDFIKIIIINNYKNVILIVVMFMEYLIFWICEWIQNLKNPETFEACLDPYVIIYYVILINIILHKLICTAN